MPGTSALSAPPCHGGCTLGSSRYVNSAPGTSCVSLYGSVTDHYTDYNVTLHCRQQGATRASPLRCLATRLQTPSASLAGRIWVGGQGRRQTLLSLLVQQQVGKIGGVRELTGAVLVGARLSAAAPLVALHTVAAILGALMGPPLAACLGLPSCSPLPVLLLTWHMLLLTWHMHLLDSNPRRG